MLRSSVFWKESDIEMAVTESRVCGIFFLFIYQDNFLFFFCFCIFVFAFFGCRERQAWVLRRTNWISNQTKHFFSIICNKQYHNTRRQRNIQQQQQQTRLDCNKDFFFFFFFFLKSKRWSWQIKRLSLSREKEQKCVPYYCD